MSFGNQKNVALRQVLAKQFAENLLIQEKLCTLPVDLFALAESRNILVQPNEGLSCGVSGMLLRHGDSFGIVYNATLNNEGYQRFSIAHELGHYFLDGHLDQVFQNGTTHHSKAGYVCSDPFEVEADNFASGLLMPSKPFLRACNSFGDGMEAVRGLATQCKTSLIATARRYIELSDIATALIVSSDGKVDYAILSNCMKKLPDLSWPSKGSSLPHGTLTHQVWEQPGRVLSAQLDVDRDTDVQEWFGGRRSVTAIEEVVGLGKYGKALTILTCPSLDEDGEADDDDGLEEGWTPKFRKR